MSDFSQNLPFAKKSLGQHWLRDEFILDYIVDFAEVTGQDTVLEVGPGVGTLTAHLASKAHKVIAVEFDETLAGKLADTYRGSNVTVVQEDILKFDLRKLPNPYKVVANIPYYLTSNLVRVMLESENPPSHLVLLVQKEVAERIAAKPGSMSVLSVSVQFYCDTVLGDVVGADFFTPPPKVDSQVIKMVYRPQPLFPGVDSKVFFRLVKAGFSEKRKKLRSSLSGGLRIAKPEAETLLEKAGIDPNKRAQELSLTDWYALYTAFTE